MEAVSRLAGIKSRTGLVNYLDSIGALPNYQIQEVCKSTHVRIVTFTLGHYHVIVHEKEMGVSRLNNYCRRLC